MYRPGRPLLSESEMRELKQLARDGFATVAAMSDPPQMVIVSRLNTDTDEDNDHDPIEAVVRHDQGSVGQGMGGETTGIVGVLGTIRREAPWDIRLGDRVKLEDGRVLIIVAPEPYEHLGVVRARWQEEQSTP